MGRPRLTWCKHQILFIWRSKWKCLACAGKITAEWYKYTKMLSFLLQCNKFENRLLFNTSIIRRPTRLIQVAICQRNFVCIKSCFKHLDLLIIDSYEMVTHILKTWSFIFNIYVDRHSIIRCFKLIIHVQFLVIIVTLGNPT